jgi:hypothetical protein
MMPRCKRVEREWERGSSGEGNDKEVGKTERGGKTLAAVSQSVAGNRGWNATGRGRV